jgi:hypothetical protein
MLVASRGAKETGPLHSGPVSFAFRDGGVQDFLGKRRGPLSDFCSLCLAGAFARGQLQNLNAGVADVLLKLFGRAGQLGHRSPMQG